MSYRPKLASLLPLFVTLLGCNALFGIDDASVKPGEDGRGGDGGAGGSGGGSSGTGGGQGGVGGTGGVGGAGGAAGAGGGAGKVQIAAGANHTCAWLPGGGVQCWGAGDFGQLGNRVVETSKEPTTVLDGAGVPLSGITQVALGNRHSCALDAQGGVLCWGSNSNGQVGAPASTSLTTAPARVNDAGGTPLSGVQHLALGDSHSCALLASGAVACWGASDFDQLGSAGGESNLARLVTDGSTSNALADVRQLEVGDFFNCVLTNSSKLLCWGSNTIGQLGSANLGGTYATALPVVDSAKAEFGAFEQIALGGFHACGLVSGGRVRCWGSDEAGQLGALTSGAGGAGGTASPLQGARSSPGPHPDPVPVVNQKGNELKAALSLSLGTRHSCALFDGGLARCWGRNSGGELGDNTIDASDGARPVRQAGGGEASGAHQLALGDQHSCAATGLDVYCWGTNLYGQLGRAEAFATTTPTLSPQLVEGLSLAPP